MYTAHTVLVGVQNHKLIVSVVGQTNLVGVLGFLGGVYGTDRKGASDATVFSDDPGIVLGICVSCHFDGICRTRFFVVFGCEVFDVNDFNGSVSVQETHEFDFDTTVFFVEIFNDMGAS